jgi:hypothetical protein
MFDDIIKGKANEHEAPVPPDAWDNIVKKKNKRRAAFWWWGSTFFILLGLSTAGYFLIPETNNKVGSVAKRQNNNEGSTQSFDNNLVGNKSKEQGANEQPLNYDKKQEMTLPGENTESAKTDAAAENNSTGSKKKITANRKATTTITISATIPDENNNQVAGNTRKIKKTKGRLTSQQINPGIDEDIILKESLKIKTNVPVVEKENKEAINNNEEINQTTIITVTDIKNTTAEADKKKDETDNKKKEQPEKSNTRATKQKIKKHWFVEAAAVPLIASSHYNKNIPFSRTLTASNSVTVYKANLVNASIEPAVAFSFFMRRELSKKLDIGTGLQYMLLKEKMNIEGKETNTTSAIVQRLVNGQLLPDTVVTVTEGTRSISAVNSYQLFSIPLFLQYSIIENKQWNIGAVGGVYFNISSNYKDEINRNAAAPLQGAPGTRNKSNTGMDIFAGIRIGKKLNKRLDFFSMPSIRLGLAKYNVKNSLLDKNINQGGVGFGLCYKIN